MSDILQEAEALIEKHATSGYIHRDATLLLPGLVSEIKRLQDENDYLRNGTCLGCVAKLEELAKWQQIAIQQRAIINFIEGEERYAYSEHVILSDKEMSEAAKELGLQYTFKTTYEPDGPIEINGEMYVKAAYIELLEKEFLDHTAARIYYESIPGVSDYWSWHDYPEEPCQMRPKQWFRDQAQAALEKIRMG